MPSAGLLDLVAAWYRKAADGLGAQCVRADQERLPYSNTIVYNNFPWPQTLTERQKQAIENAAQTVLDARIQFPDSSLADLYDPLTMPPALTKAHQKLDAAVDAAYAKRKFSGDRDRVAFLFTLYQQLTSLLSAPNSKPWRRQSRTDQ